MGLLARLPLKLFDGQGGSYSAWSELDCTALGEARVGGGMVLLRPLGFALPHYADSSKVALVLQGTRGVVGMVLPRSSEERVMKLRKGDIIPVPLGAVSWWFNDGRDNSDDLVIVFLGDTSNAHIPGKISYFFLTGPQGMLAGFSPEIIRRAYNMNAEEAAELTQSQPFPLIVKLDADTGLGDLDETEPLIGIRPALGDGGATEEMPGSAVLLLEQAGLSARCAWLEAGAVLGPAYTADGSSQVVYFVKGSGKVEIVGIGGKRCVEEVVEEGQLIVVPKFFAVAAVAGEDGMECFTVTTSPQPDLKELAGRASPWTALSPAALRAALNLNPQSLKSFLSKTDLSYL